MPVIPDLGRLRQGDHEFGAGLGDTARQEEKITEKWVFLYSYMFLILGIFFPSEVWHPPNT